MLYIVLFCSLFWVDPSIAGYALEDDYNSSTFFNMFEFFSGSDPTNGFVKFVDQTTAQSSGLISSSNGSVTLSVDSTNITPSGRPSIRIQSKKSYDSGLFIADISHMPGGICGTWPAFWTVGPNWPQNGEIDIIEGVNSATANAMTLHTAPGCTISNNGPFSGHVETTNCYINAPGQGDNVGCGIHATVDATYGIGFNSGGGGVYATEWSSEGITVWYFQRSQIPNDITSGSPDPSSWAEPLAKFQGSCNFQTLFQNQSIVVDTTFCGSWAGQQSVWEADQVCASKAATCQDYVQNNPQDFAQAFWKFNSIKVYQLGGASVTSQQNPQPTSTSVETAATASASTSPTSKTRAVPTTFFTSISISTTTSPSALNSVTLTAALSTETYFVDLTMTVMASQIPANLVSERQVSTLSVQEK